MSATLEQAEAVERGGLLRDAGILRASEKKTNREPAGLLRAESRFLDVLLLNGSASSDDAADDLDAKHDDGGHWLGGIFLRLSRGGADRGSRLGAFMPSGSASRPADVVEHRTTRSGRTTATRRAIDARRSDHQWNRLDGCDRRAGFELNHSTHERRKRTWASCLTF